MLNIICSFTVVMVIIMVGAMWNYRKSRKINPSRKRYGKKVKVGDKYMRVSIMGKSSKISVLMPLRSMER